MVPTGRPQNLRLFGSFFLRPNLSDGLKSCSFLSAEVDYSWTIWPQLASSVRCWLFVQSLWLFNASFHHANHPNHPSWKKKKQTHTHTHHLLLPTKNLLQKFLILSHHSDLENPELTQDVMIQNATFRWHQLVTVANPSWMFFFAMTAFSHMPARKAIQLPRTRGGLWDSLLYTSNLKDSRRYGCKKDRIWINIEIYKYIYIYIIHLYVNKLQVKSVKSYAAFTYCWFKEIRLTSQ